MPTWMGICRCCHKSKNASLGSSGSPHLPMHERPDTLFDRVMFAVPNWLWGIVGVAVLLGGVGRIGLGVVRYQNGSRDFGDELSSQMMKRPEAASLTKVSLHLGDGVYDEDTMTKRHNDYKGEVRYRDGDVGVIELDVKSRDWLYQPDEFSFKFQPKDFGNAIGNQIRGVMNQKLSDVDSDFRVSSVWLSRQSRAEYKGSYSMEIPNRPKYRSGGDISATVQTFHDDGSPATWTYTID